MEGRELKDSCNWLASRDPGGVANAVVSEDPGPGGPSLSQEESHLSARSPEKQCLMLPCQQAVFPLNHPSQ